MNWIKIKSWLSQFEIVYPKVTFLQWKGGNKDSVRSLIKGHHIYNKLLLYLGEPVGQGRS
jgi:hypothetical protein